MSNDTRMVYVGISEVVTGVTHLGTSAFDLLHHGGNSCGSGIRAVYVELSLKITCRGYVGSDFRYTIFNIYRLRCITNCLPVHLAVPVSDIGRSNAVQYILVAVFMDLSD